jgi:DNA mismatch repair protein MutS
MLLFGTNACGKSTLMKATGLSLIMAQCGMFVPASNFNYSPYKYFFTRILSNDNIYKGLSSFAVEMTELRSILKRTDNRGLVLGDEVCNGTESRSALAIVTAALMRLSEKKSNFIFATHLHELNDMPELDIQTLKKYHLKVHRKDSELIYDRKLVEGSGPAVYGLEVARAMDLDNDFIDNANKILLRITEGTTDIVEEKTSHFNSSVNVSDCKVCGAAAKEVHHIKEQNTADTNGMIKHIHKNRKSNLVPLCEECHNSVHHGKLVIRGFLDTSKGPKLDFEYLEEEPNKKKSKYTDEQIVLIKNIRFVEPIRSRAVLELKKKGVEISSVTLKKYWDD